MNHAPRTSSTAAHAGHSAQSGGASHAATNHGRSTGASNAHGSHAAAGGQSHTAAHAAAGGATNPHAGLNHDASGHAMPGMAPRPVDDGTRKLLELTGELVRDPAVQREIQQDPALREAWSDPAVRRVVTKQP
jgi:hypothetical protein